MKGSQGEKHMEREDDLAEWKHGTTGASGSGQSSQEVQLKRSQYVG